MKMKKPPSNRGGKRAGAGRKPRPEGRAVIRTISLTKEQDEALDARRGGIARGAWLAEQSGI